MMYQQTSSPNQWGCQGQNAPSRSDEMWDVEWGSKPAGQQQQSQWNASSSWGNSQWQAQGQCQPQAVYYVPMGFVATMSGTQKPAMSCVVPNYTPAASLLGTSQSNDKSGPTADSVKTAGEYDLGAPAYDGELPSVGSVGHEDGSCKRCAFFPKGRCNNGKDCTHCHFDHQPRLRVRRVRAQQKGAREQCPSQETMETEAPENNESDREMTGAASSSDGGDILNIIEVVDGLVLGSDITSMKDEQHTFHNRDDSTEVSAVSDVEVVEGSSSEDAEVSTPKATRKSGGLASSPTSWSAQQRSRKSGFVSEDLPAADIGRMVRALLNKLTEERFELLVGQILALPLSTTEQLDVLAAEIFEKATTQDGFRSLYTELCKRLDTHLAEQSGAVGGKAFRKALVNECQATFDRNLQPVDAAVFSGLSDDERLESEIKLKTLRIGNMRFIGELLVRKLLAAKLMPPIVHQLLIGESEAMLESLIALLTVVAPSFEQAQSIYAAPLKDAFGTLRRKSNEKGTSSLLRCQILDLLEARTRGWAARAL